MKFVIVGFGSIGKRHLRSLQKEKPSCEVRIVTRSPIADLSGSNVFQVSTIREAIDFGPSLVIISTPSPTHLEYAIEFVKHGIDLFVEKPISPTSEGLWELISLCKTRNVFLRVGYNLRFTRSLILFKQIISNHEYGRILSVESSTGQYLPDWRPGSNSTMGISASEKDGGGALLELSHELDFMFWIFGEPRLVSSSMGRYSQLVNDVEDWSQIIMEYTDSNGSSFPGTLTLDLFRRDPRRECVVCCEKATVRWDGINGSVDIYEPLAKEWVNRETFENDVAHSYDLQMKDVLEAIQERRFDFDSVVAAFNVVVQIETIKNTSVSKTNL